MKRLIDYVTFTAMAVSILIVSTQVASAAPPNFKALVDQFINLINLATTALFGLAIVYFFTSLVRNLWGYQSGNADQAEKLRQTITWGILTIFVMVSIWGIIAILQQTLLQG